MELDVEKYDLPMVAVASVLDDQSGKTQPSLQLLVLLPCFLVVERRVTQRDKDSMLSLEWGKLRGSLGAQDHSLEQKDTIFPWLLSSPCLSESQKGILGSTFLMDQKLKTQPPYRCCRLPVGVGVKDTTFPWLLSSSYWSKNEKHSSLLANIFLPASLSKTRLERLPSHIVRLHQYLAILSSLHQIFIHFVHTPFQSG